MKSSVRIERIKKETRDAFTLILEDNAAIATYEPGQFLNIFCKINGEVVSRPYSFSSSPFLNEPPALTIKRMPGGIMSNYLFENLMTGDQIEVSMPAGRFTTNYYKGERHLFMIAGGSGITPIFSILKSVLHNEPNSRVSLYYANRNHESIIFKDQLNELKKLYSGRLEVVHFLGAVEGPNIYDEKLVRGRIGEMTIERFLKRRLKEDETLHVFVCGPDGLMDSSVASLLRLGVEKNQIQTGSFDSNNGNHKKGVLSNGMVLPRSK